VGDDDPYPGSMLFPLAQATGGLALLAPHLEAALAAHPGLAARVQATWARGLRHVVDRLLAAYLTTTMNQSSHLLVAVEELAHGLAGLPQAPLYRALARASAARFVEAIQPAGWFEEASGPSPSYAGMQHWHLARYLQLTAADPGGEDAAVRGALAASYAFFGATVAVEPDGQRTGGFDFTHRIGTGFEEEQWRGARGMAEGIPEVAAWTAWAFPAAGPAVEAARASLASFAASFGGSVAAVPRSSLLGQASVATSLDSAARVTPAALPFQRPGSFVQPYGAPGAPQLVTVRRELPGGDAWYAAVYVGATAPSYAYSAHYAETRAVPVTNHGVVVEDVPARDDPSTGAATAHSIDVYASSPMLSGGLTLLGSTRFGSAVVGASWSPLTHHGLVAELVAVDGARSRRWARYPTVTLDPALPGADGACARALADQPRLTSSPTTPGEAPGVTTFAELDGDLGLCAARHLRFDDAGVHVRVVVRRIAAGTASPARLFENVPMPTCTRDGCAAAGPTGSAASQRNRKAAGATLAAAPWGFALRDSAGHGLDLVLETPTPGSAHPEGMRHAYYGDELQLGRVELELAAPAAIGDEVEVAYRLLPVSAP
jgi:hypothetical protein